MDIGKKIKQARSSAGLTQAQLGDLLGVSGSMIGQWETNVRKPKPETLLRLSDALDITFGDFFPEDVLEGIKAGFERGMEEEQEQWKLSGYTFDLIENLLIESFWHLNEEGKRKALEYVEDIADNPKYQRELSADEVFIPNRKGRYSNTK